jgi:hypothetical protein
VAAVAGRDREQLDAGAGHGWVRLRSSEPADLCIDAVTGLRPTLDDVMGGGDG